MSRLPSRPKLKNTTRLFRQRLLGCQLLEDRRLMAVTTPDWIQFVGPTIESSPDDPFLSEWRTTPTQSSSANFPSVIDLLSNTAGDQSIRLPFVAANPGTRIAEAIAVSSTATYQVEVEFPSISTTSEFTLIIDQWDDQRTLLASSSLLLRPVASPSNVSGASSTRYRGLIGSDSHGTPWNRIPLSPSATKIEVRSLIEPSRHAWLSIGFLDDPVSNGTVTATWQGSDLLSSQQSDSLRRSDESFPADPSSTHRFSVQVDRLDTNLPPQSHSLGYIALDADGMEIDSIHVVRYSTATDTRLAAPLNPGDTSIELVDATGWSNQSPDPRTRALAWYGYQNSRGETYQDYTYTRLTASHPTQGLWDIGAIQGNRITLNQPWSGPALATDTAIRNAVVGEPLFANLLDQSTLSSPSQTLQKEIQGTWNNGIPSASAFPPGIHRLLPAVHLNRSSLNADEPLRILYRFGVPGNAAPLLSGNQRQFHIPVLENDTLPASTPIESVTQGRFGSVTIVRGTNNQPDRLQYVAEPHFIGVDSFTYSVIDPSDQSTHTEHVVVHVLGNNLTANPALQDAIANSPANPDSPIALPNAHAYWTLNSRELLADGIRFPSLLEGADNQGMPLAVTLVNGTQHGSLEFHANGSFRYLANPGYSGRDAFQYQVHNGKRSVTRTATIEVFANSDAAIPSLLGRLHDALQSQVASQSRFFYPTNPAYFDAQGKPWLSWRVHLLPFLGFQSLYERFHLDEPWDSANNLSLLEEMPDLFRDPLLTGPSHTTRFLPLENIDAVPTIPLMLDQSNFANSRLLPTDRIDGPQDTILLLLAGSDKAIEWTKPNDLPLLTSAPLTSLGTVGPFTSMVFADGSVRRVPTDIPDAQFLGMASLQESAGQITPSVPNLGRVWADRPDSPESIQDYDNAIGDDYLLSIAHALREQATTTGNFTPDSLFPRDANNQPFLSWRVYLLPYLGYQSLFDQFKLDEAWDSPNNLPLLNLMPDLYRAPGADPSTNTTRLRWLAGDGAPFTSFQSTGAAVNMSLFQDGLDTLLLVEAGEDRAVHWTQPDTLTFNAADPWTSLGQFPTNRMRAALADGRIVSLPTALTPSEILSLVTSSGQEARDNETLLRNGPNPPWSQSHRFQKLSEAWLAYVQANNAHPSNGPMPGFTEPVSWRVKLLPYLGESGLYAQYRFDQPWNSQTNLLVLDHMPEVFRPSHAPTTSQLTQTRSFVGEHAILLPNGIARTPSDLTDALTSILVVTEVGNSLAVPWTQPTDLPVDEQLSEKLQSAGNSPLGLWADGSQRRIDYRHQTETLLRYVTIDDGSQSTITTLAQIAQYLDEGGSIRTIQVDAVASLTDLVFEIDQPLLVQLSSPSSSITSNLGDRRWQISLEARDNNLLDGLRSANLRIGVRSVPGDDQSPLTVLRTFPLAIVDNEKLQISLAQNIAENNAGTVTIARNVEDTSQALDVSLQLSDASEATAPLVVTIPAGESSVTFTLSGVEDFIQDGDQAVMLRASASGFVPSQLSFQVLDVNYAPTITAIASQAIEEDSQTSELSFDISDLETPPADLVVSVTSDNPTLVANAGLSVGGTSATRTLRVTPLPNQFGQAQITITVSDGSRTTSSSFTLQVSPIADTPSPLQINAVEDTRTAPFTLQANPLDGNEVTHFRISGITGGNLYRAGQSQPIPDGTYLTRTDAESGLEFLANPQFQGTAQFLLEASQDGTSVSAQSGKATATIQVVSVNDPPTSQNVTVSTLEDTPMTLQRSQFAFADPNDSPANLFTHLRIVTLPTAGLLTLQGQSLAADTLIPIAAIDAGRLVYTPGLHGNGTAYATFTFQVQDDGGTTQGGNPLSTPHTWTIDVASRNDAPQGTNRSLQIIEDTIYTVQLDDFGFIDPDDQPANPLFAVHIVTPPATGTLELNGLAVVAGQVVFRTDLLAGKLRYSPPLDAQGNAVTSLTFRVQDNGGTAQGGVDLDTQARTLFLDIASANDAPIGLKVTLVGTEDTPLEIGIDDLGFTDPKDTPNNQLQWIRIASLPSSGSLEFNNAPVTAQQIIAASDVAAGKLRYIPAANVWGTQVASFAIDLRDDGGPDWSAIPSLLTIELTPTNDPPVSSNSRFTVAEDTSKIILLDAFPFTDPLDTPANNLKSVRIVSLPTGSLTLNGLPVTVDQVIERVDIDSGHLRYLPPLDQSGLSLDSFGFQIQDTGGQASNGLDTDPIPRTMTIDVTPVVDPPVIASAETVRDTLSPPITLQPNSVDGNSVTHFRIVRVIGGVLFLDGALNTPLKVGDWITLEQGATGVRFLPDLGRTDAGELTIAGASSASDTTGSSSTSSVTITAGPGSTTSLSLSRSTIYRNVTGAWIGELKGTDSQNSGETFSWQVLDDRFRLEGQQLFLKDGISITDNVGTEIPLRVLAQRTGATQPTSRVFLLTVAELPATWTSGNQNGTRPLDVNDDGLISPLDALLIINELNLNGSRTLPAKTPGTGTPFFLDVSGEGSLSPLDALQILNFLNSNGSTTGEGEGTGAGAGAGEGEGEGEESSAWTVVGTGLAQQELMHFALAEFLSEEARSRRRRI